MAKSTTIDRIIHSIGIAKTDGSPSVWKPPTLKTRPLPERLPLSSSERAEKSETDPAPTPAEPGMVFIPPGTFVIGDDEGANDAKPQHRVMMNGYWVDRLPVTNADYKAFVEATGHRSPAHWVTGSIPTEKGKHPVTNVRHSDTVAFSRWAGKRLPTEAEWEKAARGTDGQTYAWGNAFRKDNCNNGNNYGDGDTTPVDRFPNGASPYGVLDTCGNVMEWCSDYYDEDYYQTAPHDNPEGPPGGRYRVIRGGFYSGNKADVQCAARHWAPEETLQDHIGFRCAKTPGQKPEAPAMAEATPLSEGYKVEPISDDQSLETIAESHPESVAKVIRARLNESGDDEAMVDQMGALMITLCRDLAAGVMKYLTTDEIGVVADAMAARAVVTGDERQSIQKDVRSRVLSGTHLDYGGTDFTQEVLERALGPRRAQRMMDQAVVQDTRTLRLLDSISPEQILPFFMKEQPQTIALIVSQIDPVKASEILALMPEDRRREVVTRMAHLETVRVNTLRSLEDSLAKELEAMLTGNVDVGGVEVVAAVLGHAEDDVRKDLLATLKAADAEMAAKIEQAGGNGGSIDG